MTQQKNTTKTKITSEEDNFIGVPITTPNPDNAWKAVGSPSRRGSTTAMTHFLESSNSPNQSPVNDHVDIMRRSSIVSESNANWGSFGGFQWEGPSIFDEDGKPVSIAPTQPAPDSTGDIFDNSIRSVPMLPGVSVEPIYRQQRSLSFSMGQEPTFFGYDDYDDQVQPQYKQPTFNSSLAPMVEEEDGFIDEFDLAHIRSRSKSSGAAFGLLSQNQHSRLMNNGHIRRGSEQQEDLMINQRRRSSSRFFHIEQQPTNDFNNNQMSLGDKERLDIIQRRLSQQQEYSFPETTTTSNGNFNLLRRQSLTLATQPPSNIQQLADQLENTHLRSELNAFQQQLPQQQQLSQQQPYLYVQPNYHNPSSYLQSIQQQSIHQQQNIQQQQQNLQQQQNIQQAVADEYFDTDARGYQDLGKGIPVHRLDPQVPLYMVEFKGGRTDFFYVLDSNQFHPQKGDLVIVEADRGKDLGKVMANTLTMEQVTKLEQQKQLQLQQIENKEENNNEEMKQPREIHIKRIFRLATQDEIGLLQVKGQDELKALGVCQQKTKQRKLPMEVVDAEYQWDRRKLTFYFQAENRIDFRELVRELFKIYKTRIWMCVVTPPITLDDI